MRRRITPVRARILVATFLIVAATAYGGLFLIMRTQQLSAEGQISDRNESLAQLVKLFVELRYPGDWTAAGSTLLKGGAEPPSGEALWSALNEYLPPDAKISFVVGAPPEPAERKAGPDRANPPSDLPPDSPTDRPTELPPELPPGAARAEARQPPKLPDFPFSIPGGAGVALRGADDAVLGWIRLETDPEDRSRREGRSALSYAMAAFGAVFAMVTALGVILLWLSKPIDRMAEEGERAAARNEELATLSMTDGLTGLLNRRGVEAALDGDEDDGAAPSHVAIVDLDHFKAINDTHGHDEGDRTLSAVGALLSTATRKGDYCARWGGEEFLVLFHGLAAEDAGISAERLRVAVAGLSLGSPSAPYGVTATIGIAPLRKASVKGGLPRAFEEALSAADGALYKGKVEGRNRVVVAG